MFRIGELPLKHRPLLSVLPDHSHPSHVSASRHVPSLTESLASLLLDGNHSGELESARGGHHESADLPNGFGRRRQQPSQLIWWHHLIQQPVVDLRWPQPHVADVDEHGRCSVFSVVGSELGRQVHSRVHPFLVPTGCCGFETRRRGLRPSVARSPAVFVVASEQHAQRSALSLRHFRMGAGMWRIVSRVSHRSSDGGQKTRMVRQVR